MRLRVLGGFLLSPALSVGVGACSSTAASSAPPQTLTPVRVPATPDPCKVLDDAQVLTAYSGDDGATQSYDLEYLTHKGDYNPTLGPDEVGASLSCSWSAPGTFAPGRFISMPLMDFSIAPAYLHSDVLCVKQVQVSGIGQTACADREGGLNAKHGFFSLTIQDYASATGDLAVEEQLATEAITALRGSTQGAS